MRPVSKRVGFWHLLNDAAKGIPKIIVTFAIRAASAKRGSLTTAQAGHHAKMREWPMNLLRIDVWLLGGGGWWWEGRGDTNVWASVPLGRDARFAAGGLS
jgi:hypothetical protein